jgi:hypothetical protein
LLGSVDVNEVPRCVAVRNLVSKLILVFGLVKLMTVVVRCFSFRHVIELELGIDAEREGLVRQTL